MNTENLNQIALKVKLLMTNVYDRSLTKEEHEYIELVLSELINLDSDQMIHSLIDFQRVCEYNNLYEKHSKKKDKKQT